MNREVIIVRVSEMKKISVFLPVVTALCALSLVSCDKGKELFQSATDKVNEFKKDDASSVPGALVTTVSVVNETDGKAVIMDEMRLVVVEFYSDT